MSKVITSPVPEFPGTVVLHDPLTFPMIIAYNEAFSVERTKNTFKNIYVVMKGILPCIEAWHLQGWPDPLDPDTIPVSPIDPVADVVNWVAKEINAMVFRAKALPKA